MSGIAGAIFFDQAFAVTVGLMVSYFTGIMLLPVLYKLVYSIPEIKHSFFNLKINNLIKEHTLDRFYDGGLISYSGIRPLATICSCHHPPLRNPILYDPQKPDAGNRSE